MITQTLKLNLIPGQVLPRVNVSQYDAGTRTLQMLLYNGDQTFNISSGMSGFVQGTKPDRTGFQYPATVTQGSNVVTLVVTQQMTAVSGEVTCELVIADGDNRIATVNFIIYVEPAALADDTVISDTELPLIEEAAELAQRIDGIAQQVSDDADRAETAADNAELWASRSPYIGQNGNWFVFDTTTEAYIDTRISATGPQGQTGPTGPQGPQGDAATITVGTVTTLPAGSQATVTNSGTSEEAVFNFGIPKGQDGTGAGDMAKADYDANGAVENAGGIASYVSGAISGKANTADLGTAAYKDSTNAVTSGSTDLVESGAVYDAIQTVSNQVATKASQADLNNVAQKVSNSGDVYSSSKAYKVGDLVIHDDMLYKCTTACSAAAWNVNQSCFITDTLTNVATLFNTRLTAINKIYQSNLNEAKTIGTGVGCGYIHNLPKGIYLVYTEVGYSKNLSAGARRQVFEGEADLQTNIQILDEFDQYWHSVRSVAILNWQSMRDIYFTAMSSDHTDSFSFASVTCIPINI